MAAIAAVWWWSRGASDAPRGPIAIPNPGSSSPVESLVGRVRHVIARGAPERLLLDSIPPTKPARLLWLEGKPVAALPGGSAVLDESTILQFDRELRITSIRVGEPGGPRFEALAPAGSGEFWLAGGEANLARANASGRLVSFAVDSSGYPAESGALPFDRPQLAADPWRGSLWLARSPEQVSFGFYPGPPPPLFVRLDSTGRIRDSISGVVIPAHALLTDLANAGRLVAQRDTVYWAPMVRDEVLAITASGDTAWVLTGRARPLQTVREPRLMLEDRKPVVDYTAVNLGIAIGPDDRLYVLSTTGDSTAGGRIDVLDRASGRLLRSAELQSPLPTVAADDEGRVYLLNPVRLVGGIAPLARETLVPFDLERLDGGQDSSSALLGKVVLVNFWASWCGPCKVEMPALDSLRRTLTDPSFVFLTITEDLNVTAAREFLARAKLDIPVLLGRGRMKSQYHYLGLPYTILIDRSGRVAQRWTGFSGDDQISTIRRLILQELKN